MSLARRILIVLLAGYWLGLLYLMHYPKPYVLIRTSDKLAHGLVYLMLTVLWWAAVCGWRPVRIRGKQLWLSMLFLLVYASADELTQPLTGRYASVGDALADAAGVVAAMAVIWLAQTIGLLLRPRSSV